MSKLVFRNALLDEHMSYRIDNIVGITPDEPTVNNGSIIAIPGEETTYAALENDAKQYYGISNLRILQCSQMITCSSLMKFVIINAPKDKFKPIFLEEQPIAAWWFDMEDFKKGVYRCRTDQRKLIELLENPPYQGINAWYIPGIHNYGTAHLAIVTIKSRITILMPRVSHRKLRI